MDKMRITAFLMMAEMADSFTGKELRDVRREAVQLGKNRSYREAFRTETIQGLSCINYAISKECVLLPLLLLEHLKVDPCEILNDPKGRTTLHYVAEVGQMEILKKLVKDYPVDINATDISGLTPLHLAICYGKTDLACKLLEFGATADGDFFFGRALHASAYMDQLTVVKKIHTLFPVEVDTAINEYCTPLTCALYGNSAECMNYLRKFSTVMLHTLLAKVVSYMTSEDAAFDTVVFLLVHGADANVIDEELFEQTPIIVAAKKKWQRVVKVLLSRTTPIHGVEWTTHELLRYVETEEFRQLDENLTTDRVERLKTRLTEELQDKHVLAATLLCMALKPNLDEIEYGRYQSLCKVFWFCGIESSFAGIEVSAVSIFQKAACLSVEGRYNWALTAIDACLALDPENLDYSNLREDLVRIMSGEGTSHH